MWKRKGSAICLAHLSAVQSLMKNSSTLAAVERRVLKVRRVTVERNKSCSSTQVSYGRGEGRKGSDKAKGGFGGDIAMNGLRSEMKCWDEVGWRWHIQIHEPASWHH
jgi:hypothetical protein